MEQRKVLGDTGEHRLIAVERRFKLIPKQGGMPYPLSQGTTLQEAIKEARKYQDQDELWIEETLVIRSKVEIPQVTRTKSKKEVHKR